MITVNLEDDPPRPATGDGEVIVKGGRNDVVLRWENGEIAEVTSRDSAVMMSDLTMKTEGGETSTGAIICYRCAIDTDTGLWWCWQVPCGT